MIIRLDLRLICMVFSPKIIAAVYLHESEAAPKPFGLIKAKVAKTKLAVAKTKLALLKVPKIIAAAKAVAVIKGVKAKAKLAAAKAVAIVRIQLIIRFDQVLFDFLSHVSICVWNKFLFGKFYRPKLRKLLQSQLLRYH